MWLSNLNYGKTAFETSRTKRLLIEGNMENNHSNEEALTCRGFYIREKTSKMVPLSNSESLTDKINNMAVGENAPAAFNGENDKNEEHDKDALKEDHHLILQIESNKNLESLKQNVEKTEEPKTYTKNESKEIYSNIETGKELNTETEDLLIISWNDNVCENLNKEESKSISNIKTTEPNPNEKSSEKITGSSNEVIESKSPSKSQSQLSTCSSSTLDADIDDIDEDFDPSLLCPDISMDVDEVPVVTNENQMPETSSSSPLPYEPIFSTVVDEMTGAEVQVNLTPAEMELRSKMFAESSPVQSRKIHCTACNIHLGSALTGANNRFVHPLLKVLICKNCYHFYTSGEFEKDEDGSELYCRWCGQGGQVLCCSNCEYVFCKKCIRNNFGQRKFKEIRDSDDWSCFKCAPEQLSPLRAFCAEFMDYYRTELVRAQALADVNPTLMSTDYTTCCSGQLPKKEDFKTLNIQKNRKKRKDDDNDEDPDYEPVMEDYEPPNKKFALNPLDATTVNITTPGMRQIAPKISTAIMRPMTGQPIRPQVFNIGNTTFRSQGPVYTMSQSVINPANNIGTTQGFIAVSAKPGKPAPGFIQLVQQPHTVTTSNRLQNTFTVVSGVNNGKPMFSTVQTPGSSTSSGIKHEWFEKTVRAAARVNSNLSYTLTQLNRQQSQASTVESLATVHNKLQEVLSTSINTLIQIRKSLRTEFIAGIRNMKFPPAKPHSIPPSSGPIIVKDDDDVILVTPKTTVVSQSHPPPLVLNPAVIRKPQIIKTSPVKPKPSTSTTSNTVPMKGGFLKVRSLSALQTVPSECITIPDDPVVIIDEDSPITNDKNGDEHTICEKPLNDSKANKSNLDNPMEDPNPSLFYNVKEKPSSVVTKMMQVHVLLHRSQEIEERLKRDNFSNSKT